MNLWLPDLYVKAWDFATVAHEGQTYGGRTEGIQINYLNHVGSVAMEVIWTLQNSKVSYDANLAIQCAILHDIIEDTEYTYQDILSVFGKQVADGVLALSKDESIPSRNIKMIDSINRIKTQPYEIWIVKMADRISNLYYPPYYWNKEKIISYREEAKLIYQELKSSEQIIAARLLEKIDIYQSFTK